MDAQPADPALPATDAGRQGDHIYTVTPNAARRYDYWLGGKDNFPADRASGDAIEQRYPAIRCTAIANRAFLQRAVRYLAHDAGIRQFLDVGAGIPTSPNVHEIAQTISQDARVVYVDNDPVVGTHARARMTDELVPRYDDVHRRRPPGTRHATDPSRVGGRPRPPQARRAAARRGPALPRRRRLRSGEPARASSAARQLPRLDARHV